MQPFAGTRIFVQTNSYPGFTFQNREVATATLLPTAFVTGCLEISLRRHVTAACSLVMDIGPSNAPLKLNPVGWRFRRLLLDAPKLSRKPQTTPAKELSEHCACK